MSTLKSEISHRSSGPLQASRCLDIHHSSTSLNKFLMPHMVNKATDEKSKNKTSEQKPEQIP
jgi:hypothetical protein